MTTGAGFRWDEADRLFDQALELPPGERQRWLDQRCGGNAALRQQVEALLQADADAGTFLERDGWQLAEPFLQDPDEAAVAVIGSYRVVGELGHGGMGVVYLAESEMGQPVALKLIKRGLDSEQIHRRFLEPKILGRLVHSNIARLLDGGMTTEGRRRLAGWPWSVRPAAARRPGSRHPQSIGEAVCPQISHRRAVFG